jgi:hypothetical protein
MGEYADDLIDAGMMEHPWGYSYRSRRTVGRKPSRSARTEMPKVSNEDFEAWYKSHEPWGSCSKYEIAGMAWMEVLDRMKAADPNDQFTQWFDFEMPEAYHIFKTKIVAKSAWIESLKRILEKE